ncbi:MAG: AsmA family protein [Flavobacteriaceae bacterium]|nr:AsmA family protein [Flavobacteriaceae bacterium]
MKKILKITGVLFLLLLVFLLLAPFLFKGSLEELLKKNLNDNLNATVSWEEMDLSLFSSFPDAAVVINYYSVINKAPFDGDTLATGRQLKLDLGLTQLFKSNDEPIKIDALQLDEAYVNIKIDSLGRANYDIAKDDDPGTEQEDNSATENGFTFALDHYEINNSRINYLDKASGTFLRLQEVNHEGNGDLSLDLTELQTTTNALVSLQIGEVEYMEDNSISLDAVLQLDLENQKYTFKENEAKVNELPLTFQGFVQVNENDTEMDLSFRTPSSDFRNFLAVIPKVYVKNLDGVSTSGDFTVDGILKGVINDTHIPTMDIKVNSNNASFKYPDLPKAVRNISIDARLKNDTGIAEDTYLTIGGLTFRIDDEIFKANGSIRNLTGNALVNMAINGTLDLAKIEQVLPIELDQDLSGVFNANVTTNFDMRSVETEQYQNIKTTGTASLKNFEYNDPAFKDKIYIQEAAVKMTPGNITLNKMIATTGQTDIDATGNIQNLIPWIMAKQDLKGRFNVHSNTFNVNDFMASDEVTEKERNAAESSQVAGDGIRIPDFMDATLDFDAKKVIYDNVVLDNTTGTVTIADETATLKNVRSKALGGDIALAGNVNTSETTPTFNMNLDLQKIDINESFGKLSLLKYLAPIAQALDGDLNTTLNLSGTLNNDLTPNLQSLAGNAIAQVLTAQVNPQRTPLLSRLGEQVQFLNLEKLSLRDVSTALDFKDGKITVQPFEFDVKGITVRAGGSHGLDKSISYDLNMDVPARYLGGEVNSLLAKLDPKEANQMTVQVPISLKGSMTQPQIDLNMQAAVNTLTQKLIQRQKEELTTKGIDILENMIGGNKKTKDSIGTQTKGGNDTQEQTTKVVKNIIGNIFGNKKKKDSVNN